MRTCIWAQTRDGVIGRDGGIPWKHPGDLRRFKRLTIGGVVIMGRLTYESIGKALPGRTNIVVTSQSIAMAASASGGEATSIMRAASVEQALQKAYDAAPGKPFWFIGGARIYAEAMAWSERLDVVLVPDVVAAAETVVYAPPIDRAVWELRSAKPHPDQPGLIVQDWRRK